MTNGGTRSQQKQGPGHSAWDRFFLAVFCSPLVPAVLGPVPLLHAACSLVGRAATVLSAALVYSAPIVIPLLVWNALGEHHSWRPWQRSRLIGPIPEQCAHQSRSPLPVNGPRMPRHPVACAGTGVDRDGILVHLGWTTVRIYSSSKPVAYLLLGLASAAIQAAQLARQSAQARRRLAAAIALSPAAACERSPALGEERFGGATDGGSQPGSFLASGPPSTQGDTDDRTPITTEPTPDQLQELLREVSEVHKVLQGQEAADAWVAAAQHSYRAVLFEVGRLCGEVGVLVPPGEADGGPVHLLAIMQKLRAEVS